MVHEHQKTWDQLREYPCLEAPKILTSPTAPFYGGEKLTLLEEMRFIQGHAADGGYSHDLKPHLSELLPWPYSAFQLLSVLFL